MAVATTDRRLATLAQATELYPLSRDTLRRRIADGTITGYRFGPRKLMVDLDELEAAMRPIPTARAAS